MRARSILYEYNLRHLEQHRTGSQSSSTVNVGKRVIWAMRGEKDGERGKENKTSLNWEVRKYPANADCAQPLSSMKCLGEIAKLRPSKAMCHHTILREKARKEATKVSKRQASFKIDKLAKHQNPHYSMSTYKDIPQ